MALSFSWFKRGQNQHTGTLPSWVLSSGHWAPIARECNKYVAPQCLADPCQAAVGLDLSRYNPSERKAAASVGWICVQALQEETAKREAIEHELQAATEQLALLRTCVRDIEKHNGELSDQFSNYVVRTVQKHRRRKQKPLSGDRSAVRVRTLIQQNKWDAVGEWAGLSSSDEEIEIEEEEVRPIVTTKSKREVTQRASASGDHDYTQGAEQNYVEETRTYTAGELTEL